MCVPLSGRSEGSGGSFFLPFQNDDIGEMNLDLKFEKTESGDWVLVELANLSRILEKQQEVEALKKAQ